MNFKYENIKPNKNNKRGNNIMKVKLLKRLREKYKVSFTYTMFPYGYKIL